MDINGLRYSRCPNPPQPRAARAPLPPEVIVETTFGDVANCEVETLCYKTCPCKHKVHATLRDGRRIGMMMGARAIIGLHMMLGRPVHEHFAPDVARLQIQGADAGESVSGVLLTP